jgi:hypothetical protein
MEKEEGTTEERNEGERTDGDEELTESQKAVRANKASKKLEFVELEGQQVTIKEKVPRGEGAGVTDFIRKTLEAIPEGEGVLLNNLAQVIFEGNESVKDKRQAYVRLNHVLNPTSGGKPKFIRVLKDGKTHVMRRTDYENASKKRAA